MYIFSEIYEADPPANGTRKAWGVKNPPFKIHQLARWIYYRWIYGGFEWQPPPAQEKQGVKNPPFNV
jgi:hypothetical protein